MVERQDKETKKRVPRPQRKENMRNGMKINNVCITGTFRHDNKPNNEIEWTRKNILLYDNKILLKKQSFSVTLTQNIRKVLQTKNLQKLFQKRLEYELNTKVHDVKLRIGNIHESITIPCTPRQITKEFLPKLFKITTIVSPQVSQEQNTPMLLDIEPLLKGHFPFMFIKLGAFNGTANIKIQHSKDRKHTRLTIILTGFTQEMRELLDFIETFKP